ncbi:MarC family protein [Immundisolibacter sp.]|uniref:MarC family protein n=1 Tax=Immundisolibacter sp. TaxID=1934948 RepID=UPI002617F174|nr:MarC family protein [Immundisolibacter sp.]MDD3651614.1 MarC family protein [Immundisolibacter sp.]
MSIAELLLLLVLVTDPFGNLPLVLSALGRLDAAAYRRAVLRESLFAFAVLLLLGWGGAGLLRIFGISEPALHIGGGVILFLLSLRMIYGGAQGAFHDGYSDDPMLVPIAVPAIAGPAAIATVILLRTQQQVPLGRLALALLGALLVTLATFLPGRRIAQWLGPRGLNALEKLTGLLLNLIAVNMMLEGVRRFLA